MHPTPPTHEVMDAWWTLWHEPWRQAHSGWWRLSQRHDPSLSARAQGETADTVADNTAEAAPETAPDTTTDGIHDAANNACAHPADDDVAPTVEGLLALFAEAPAECRLAHRWFCRHFGIDAALPHPRPFPAAVGIPLPALPLAPDDLVAAATALGRVGYASHCLTSSRQGLAKLFSQDTQTAGDADAWRDALRQARARPLTVEGIQAPPTGGGALELQRWALPLMARLIEDAVPGAWARLRLRVDPQCFTLAPAAPVAPAAYSPALQRQAWRIWRAASHAASSPILPNPSP